MERLVARGLVMIAGVTPSDASHVLGRLDAWDGVAAEKAVRLLAKRRNGAGDRFAPDAVTLAGRIVDQLTEQTVECLLEAAFDEDRGIEGEPVALARHPLTRAGLARHRGVVEVTLRLGVPVIGLGASAPSYYGAVGDRLGCEMILPEHAGVANAIGAVVGQVSQRALGVGFLARRGAVHGASVGRVADLWRPGRGPCGDGGGGGDRGLGPRPGGRG